MLQSELLRAGISTRTMMADMLWAGKPRVDYHHVDDELDHDGTALGLGDRHDGDEDDVIWFDERTNG